jgi:hypothetical protein
VMGRSSKPTTTWPADPPRRPRSPATAPEHLLDCP